MMRIRDTKHAGAALMLSLWALFLLSAMVISWALDINSRLVVNGNANRVLEAEAMACSGAEIALHPAIKPGSSLLRQRRGNQSFETRITGEGGRLNLNSIATAGISNPNDPHLDLLRRYLELKGVDLNDRERMIDCLLDWVDPDNLVRLNGKETEGDYRPANALFRRIDDLKRVAGWEEFTSQPNWDADLRVAEPDNIGIDVVWASRDVLLTLPGINEARVDQFLAQRQGPDGVDGTDDDTEFKSREEALVALGYSQAQFPAVLPLVAMNFPRFRIVSVGKSSDVTRVVQMVVLKDGARVTLIPGTWKEL